MSTNEAAAAPAPPVVEFRDVSKTYGTGTRKEFTSIQGVSFTVEDQPGTGEFISILGPSGCGKSTVLRLIAGLAPQHPATVGAVLVNGNVVTAPGPDRGFVFQDYANFPHRTVLENVSFGLECAQVSPRERCDRAREWIGKVGLDPVKDAVKYPHELSGGMNQRVAIARSLVMHPRIILMDEPFGALDPATREHMQDLLVALCRELQATVFFVTHDVAEAVYLSDRLFLFSATPGTLKHQMAVPPPDRPAREAQTLPAFVERVREVRALLDAVEVSEPN